MVVIMGVLPLPEENLQHQRTTHTCWATHTLILPLIPGGADGSYTATFQAGGFGKAALFVPGRT